MPFLAENNRVLFRVVLGEPPAMALLDTGAAADIVDRSVLLRTPGVSPLQEPARDDLLIGFGGPVDGAAVDGSLPLRIAGADLQSRRLFAVELNTAPFRFQVDLDAIIGIGTLGSFDVLIDTSSGLLSFRRLAS